MGAKLLLQKRNWGLVMSLLLLLLYETATTEAKAQIFGVIRFVFGVSNDEKVTVTTVIIPVTLWK